jgi:biopolymer transport protein ExbD
VASLAAHVAVLVDLLPPAASLTATDRDLIPRVQRALEDKKDKIVYVRGDKDAKYAAIMDAIDALRKAQIENIALITERKQEGGKTAGGGH